MPTSFFALPRELRDQIYDYVLISPTGFITITPRSSRSEKERTNSNSPPIISKPASSSTPNFRLLISEPSTCYKKAGYGKNLPRRKNANAPTSHTSLSLSRVCKQIHAETQGLFWTHNSIYFPSFVLTPGRLNSPPTLGVVKTFKGMGQTASRLITSMTISMPLLGRSYDLLAKVLNVLASRARHGALRKLVLLWDEIGVLNLAGMVALHDGRLQSPGMVDVDERIGYSYLLDGLRTDSEACRYERIIRFPALTDKVREEWRRDGWANSERDMMAKDVHFAFGGKLYWGEQLAWENLERSATFN